MTSSSAPSPTSTSAGSPALAAGLSVADVGASQAAEASHHAEAGHGAEEGHGDFRLFGLATCLVADGLTFAGFFAA